MIRILLTTLCVATAFTSQISLAQLASDNAGNYSSGWTNGANGGTGFGAWSINSGNGTGYAGNFIGDPNSGGISGMGTQAFGFFANPTASGAFVDASRNFSAGGLTNGQVFSFKWGVNFDSGSGGNKGFNLYSGGTSGTQLVNINNGSSSAITLNGTDVGFGYGSAAMTWTFTQVSPTLLRITANDRDGTGNFTTNLVVSGRVDSFKIYASQMQAGDSAQPYFNDFAVTAASATDSDADGLPDWWELGYFGDLSKTGTGDEDSDGLNNAAEYAAGTNPNLADTDGDGRSDGAEVTAGTNPLKKNYDLITVTGSFQGWKAEPTPSGAPANVMAVTNQFTWTLDLSFPNAVSYLGKFANGQPFSSSNNINWGTSGTVGVAQQGGTGNDIPFNVTSTGWWTFTFNTDTLNYGFARKVFPNYLAYAAAYNLPAAGSGGGESEDYDGDGLTNAQEFAANMNPASGDSDEDTVPDLVESTAGTNPLLSDTDGDGLPDWYELTYGLNALVSTGPDGALGDPDGDGFNNKQEYDGQSDPKSAASVPANRSVTFALNLNPQINAGTFLTNSHTVEVWGTFNDWGNFTNKFNLTNNGSGIYSGTFAVAGAQGATNRYKFVTFASSNNAVWETGADRQLLMGANGVGTNLPTSYLGEVRPVNFSVNLGVQLALGRFSHGTNNKVYVVGDVDGGWMTGTELTRVPATDVYSGDVLVTGAPGATNSYKFRVNNSLGYEIDLDPVATGDQTRSLILGARDTTQTVPEAYFNNVTNVPANRTVTFAVNMNVQTNTNRLSFNLATDSVEVRGDFNTFGGGSLWRLTNNGSGIFTGSFVLEGAEGNTNGYKYVAVIGTNALFERVDVPRTNSVLNRTFVLGPTNVAQTVHSAASPAWFSNDDGVGPVITLKGANPLNLTNGAVFTDPGATAADAAEATSVDITGSGTVNTSVAGSYTITYSASDTAGNAATPVTRTVVVAAAGSTFAGWSTGAATNSELVGKYAIGGATNTLAASEKPVVTVGSNTLSLSAIVRTNDTNLTVVGEAGGSLTNWSTNGVSMTPSANTNGVPDGCQRRVFSVDRTNSPTKQFLRLKATLAP